MAFEGIAGPTIFRCTWWATYWAFTLGWSLRSAGREHLPKTGPVLLVANHQSLLDPPLVGAIANRPLTYLARHGLFDNKYFGALIRYYGATPIVQEMGKGGLTSTLAALERQEAVLVFPEGERTLKGNIQEMKPGISLIIKKANCTVVPVGIAGAYEALPRKRPFPHFNPLFFGDAGCGIACVYGPSIHTSELKKLSREEMLAEIDRRIRECYNKAESLRRGGRKNRS
ncbi:MAG: lysophospholipid acyltransferase family protein [Gemmataceae bacterium]